MLLCVFFEFVLARRAVKANQTGRVQRISLGGKLDFQLQAGLAHQTAAWLELLVGQWHSPSFVELIIITVAGFDALVSLAESARLRWIRRDPANAGHGPPSNRGSGFAAIDFHGATRQVSRLEVKTLHRRLVSKLVRQLKNVEVPFRDILRGVRVDFFGARFNLCLSGFDRGKGCCGEIAR